MLYEAPTEKSWLIVTHELLKVITFGKSHLHCDYYWRPRHTKEICWKLHGRPTRDCGMKLVSLSSTDANMENVEMSKEIVS